MYALVDRGEASAADLIQSGVAANGQLGPGGVLGPPRGMCRRHDSSRAWAVSEREIRNQRTPPSPHNYLNSRSDKRETDEPIGV